MTVFDEMRITARNMNKICSTFITNENAAFHKVSGFLELNLAEAGATSDQARSSVLFAFLMGRWAQSGFPTVTMGHRTAAGLMATSVSKDVAETMLAAPWPAFVIRVPDNLIKFFDPRIDDFSDVLTITVSRLVGGTWCYVLQTGSTLDSAPVSIWSHGLSTELLLSSSEELEKAMDPNTPTSLEKNADDFRNETLARNLIIGTCLMLCGSEAKSRAEIVRKARSARTRNRMPGELPDYREFEIKSEVSLDTLHAVREFARMGGRSPKVQSLIRGHFKQQAFGKERAERRLIYIQPYWRGPLDAPVVARTGE